MIRIMMILEMNNIGVENSTCVLYFSGCGGYKANSAGASEI